jgi:PKD repeat protein
VFSCTSFVMISMAFGVDGYLYVTTGDSGARHVQWSQALWNLHGSIIRVTDSGGIPSDNPFTGEGTARCNEHGHTDEDTICQEIFAYGLRNPFRFTMDPHSTDKVRFLVSEVGGTVWEEINVGGTDYSGANYGWPFKEGPCRFKRVDEECSMGDPSVPYNDPYYWYQHNIEEEGAAVGIAIPPSGTGWPSPYGDPDTFFFGDFVYGKIFHVTEDSDRACNDCIPPLPGFRNETFHSSPYPVFLKFGPYVSDGPARSSTALYYNFRTSNQHIKRIFYTGGENFAPSATFTADPPNVLAGVSITFDASETNDIDDPNDELTFLWGFGDGSSQEGGMVVSHSYDQPGTYEVHLTVTDPDGAAGSASEWISVGAPPTVEMINPVEGTMFAVGDKFTIVGTGMDHNGVQLDESTQLSWEVRQHHASHFHPFLTEGTLGNNIEILPAPSPEDLFAATNSYLEIRLTGTDSNGVSSTVSRNVMPKVVRMNFDTEPSGLIINIDGEYLTTPTSLISWENHELRVAAPEQDGYTFLGGDCLAADAEGQLFILVPPEPEGDVASYVFTFQADALPTSLPSSLPTEKPTETPTKMPSVKPTVLPSASPSFLMEPVEAPTPRTLSPTPDDQPNSAATPPVDTSGVGSGVSPLLWRLCVAAFPIICLW